jgi:hypothetical protein
MSEDKSISAYWETSFGHRRKIVNSDWTFRKTRGNSHDRRYHHCFVRLRESAKILIRGGISHLEDLSGSTSWHGQLSTHRHPRSSSSGCVYMRQDLLIDHTLCCQPWITKLMSPLTGPSSWKRALGLSSCSWIRLAISSADPIISVRSIACFFILPFVALTLSLDEGRYRWPADCVGPLFCPFLLCIVS